MEIKQKILIIDDSQIDLPVSALLIKNKFQHAEIHMASTAAIGLEWLHTHRFDLKDCLIILLDVRMPEMDGFDFLNAYDLLPDEIKSNTRIIMLSSTLDPFDIQKARQNKHVKTVLNKPLPVSELANILSEMQ